MEKFIKENCFKIGIMVAILIFILVIAYYFVIYISQKQAFENSEKCPKLAQDYVKVKNAPNYYNISYTFLAAYYSKKLNACLVDYTSTMNMPVKGEKDEVVFNEIIDNIFTNQTLLRSYYINNKVASGQSPEEFNKQKEQLFSE